MRNTMTSLLAAFTVFTFAWQIEPLQGHHLFHLCRSIIEEVIHSFSRSRIDNSIPNLKNMMLGRFVLIRVMASDSLFRRVAGRAFSVRALSAATAATLWAVWRSWARSFRFRSREA